MLLSRNYAPSDDLAPYIRRYYVFEAALPEGFEVIDQLMSETAFIRLLLRGNWAAEVDAGWASFGPVPLMGANSVPLRVRVRGGFHVVGIAIRPCGWRSLFNCPASDLADRAEPLERHWGSLADALYDAVAAAGDDAAIVAAIEQIVRRRITECGRRPADDYIARFEDIARNDCTIAVGDAARRLGISTRQLERLCRATFGHGPKVVLRRSRFLETAQAMRGFGTPSEEHLAALHYFDQSHVNREFRHFFGMTPGMFERTMTPLFTAGLKLRADGVR